MAKHNEEKIKIRRDFALGDKTIYCNIDSLLLARYRAVKI